jgi:hypothetical protein
LHTFEYSTVRAGKENSRPILTRLSLRVGQVGKPVLIKEG